MSKEDPQIESLIREFETREAAGEPISELLRELARRVGKPHLFNGLIKATTWSGDLGLSPEEIQGPGQ